MEPFSTDRLATVASVSRSNARERKALSKTSRRLILAAQASEMANCSQAVHPYLLVRFLILVRWSMWVSSGSGLQMCLRKMSAGLMPSLFSNWSLRVSLKQWSLRQRLAREMSLSTRCWIRETLRKMGSMLQFCQTDPMSEKKQALRSLPSLMLFIQLSSFRCYLLFLGLPRSLLLSRFFFAISKRQSSRPIRYCRRYLLKARGMHANPKMKKAMSPPTIPKVSQNLSPVMRYFSTRKELSKVRLQQRASLARPTQQTWFCWKGLTVQVMSCLGWVLKPMSSSQEMNSLEMERFCCMGEVMLQGSKTREVNSQVMACSLLSMLGTVKWNFGKKLFSRFLMLRLPEVVLYLLQIERVNDSRYVSSGRPAILSLSPSGAQQPNCSLEQQAGSTRVLMDLVKYPFWQGIMGYSTVESVTAPCAFMYLVWKIEMPRPLARQSEMLWGTSSDWLEKVTASLNSAPVVKEISLLQQAVELVSRGCIIQVVMPILVSDRLRQMPSQKLTMTRMRTRRMMQQQPPQQEVTSRLPLKVREGWYSKVSIHPIFNGFGCPLRQLSEKAYILVLVALMGTSFSLAYSQSSLANTLSDVSLAILLRLVYFSSFSMPWSSLSSQKSMKSSSLCSFSTSTTWTTFWASSIFSFTNTLERCCALARSKREQLRSKMLLTYFTSQRQLRSLRILRSTCRILVTVLRSQKHLGSRQAGIGEIAISLVKRFSSMPSSLQMASAWASLIWQLLQALPSQWQREYQRTMTPPMMPRMVSALGVETRQLTCLLEGLILSSQQSAELLNILERGQGVLASAAMPRKVMLGDLRMKKFLVSSSMRTSSTQRVSSMALWLFMQKLLMLSGCITRLLMNFLLSGSKRFSGRKRQIGALFMKMMKLLITVLAVELQYPGVEAQQGSILNPKKPQSEGVLPRKMGELEVILKQQLMLTGEVALVRSNRSYSALVSLMGFRQALPADVSQKKRKQPYLLAPCRQLMQGVHTANLRSCPGVSWKPKLFSGSNCCRIMTLGVLALLTVSPTVRQVRRMIVSTPHSPMKEDPVEPGLRLGLAPKRSNHSITSHSLLKTRLGRDTLAFSSQWADHLFLAQNSLRSVQSSWRMAPAATLCVNSFSALFDFQMKSKCLSGSSNLLSTSSSLKSSSLTCRFCSCMMLPVSDYTTCDCSATEMFTKL